VQADAGQLPAALPPGAADALGAGELAAEAIDAGATALELELVAFTSLQASMMICWAWSVVVALISVRSDVSQLAHVKKSFKAVDLQRQGRELLLVLHGATSL